MATSNNQFSGIARGHAFLKRSFDILLALIGLLATWWLILLAWGLATIDTRSNGFFFQKRVGRHGRIFWLVKIKTMREDKRINTFITSKEDPRITTLGRFFRKTKIDELPQLWNVLIGNMSFVGPRPDVPGYADKLTGEDRIILSVRPGITGPASLKYKNEENILEGKEDPQDYNDSVIWPDKVQVNKDYIYHYSFLKDLKYIAKTVLG